MAKDHPIDLEVRQYRAMQDRAAETKSGHRIQLILVSISLLILLSFGIGILVLPQESVSEEENRILQETPEFSISRLLSGEYTADVAAFYADQLPLRNLFVGLKAFSESLLLKQENNGVLVGSDGYLIDRLEYGDKEYETFDKNLKAVMQFTAIAERYGVPVTFAAAPRTVDVTDAFYPALYRADRASVIRTRLKETLPSAADLSIPLASYAKEGEYVTYKTDHHWTTLGAYYAYVALAPYLGYEPLPREFFTEDTVTEEFYGTTYSSSGIKWAESDSITLFRSEEDELYTVTVAESGSSTVGFYHEAFLSTKDKYSVFLGGNFGRVSIRKNGDEERPTLLLVKDSFALSIAPFLARHYDLELIDLRYYNGATAEYLTGESEELPKADRVLILLGFDSLAESEVLRKLMYGAS